MASRSPSPTRLNAVTVMKMAAPGKVTSHHAYVMYVCDCFSTSPQLAAGGGTPNPRKLRPDSVRMAPATPNVADTQTGASAFGSR